MKRIVFASLAGLLLSTSGFAKDPRTEEEKAQDIRDVAAVVYQEIMTPEQQASIGQTVVLEQSACQNPIGESSRVLRCMLRYETATNPYTFVVEAYFAEPGEIFIDSVINQYQEGDYVAPALNVSSPKQMEQDIKDIAKAIYKQTMTKEQREELGKKPDVAESECEQPVGTSSRWQRCLISFPKATGAHVFVVQAFFGEPGDIWISDVYKQYDVIF